MSDRVEQKVILHYERKKNMDVIIFSGQSNMCGETEAVPQINFCVENAYEYRYEGNCLQPLQHPVGEDLFFGQLEGSDKKRGSLVPAFCRAYTQYSKRNVVAVHVACGSTTITEWIKGTSRHFYMNQKINAAIQKVKENYTIDHIYFVWLQGESDAIIQTSETLYLERLKYHKDILKNEFGIEKFAIIKVGYFALNAGWIEDGSTEKKQWDEVIMQAQEHAVLEDEDFVMLTRICPELSLKNEYINPNVAGHYTNEGLDIIGAEAGKTLALLGNV